MPQPRHRLTPEVSATLLAFIEAGAYPHVAAEAAGVPKETFDKWIVQGEKARAKEPYLAFALKVRQAQALARVWAEIEMRKEDVKGWLTRGPGRDKPNAPGWSKETAPLTLTDNRTVNILATPQWADLWSTILHALGSFPEARMALAAALRVRPKEPLLVEHKP